ncbi:MAG: hypothetical protein ACOYO2_07395 [Mycobacterium sp.]
MIAGVTAVIGVGAIALTPIAPAVSLPSLSQIKSEVALSAFADPISALLNTGAVLGSYFLGGLDGTPAANWPGSGTFLYPDGIGAYASGGIPGNTGVTAAGIIQTAINNPVPIASALLHNWLGYGQLALAGDVATIISTVAARGTAAQIFLLQAASRLPILISAQIQLLTASMIGVLNSVVAASSAPNPVEGVWNALVNGLLDASVSGSLPATVINLTAGAGIQYAPVTAPTPPYVPSVRAIGTAVLGGLANVLSPTRVGLYPPEEDNVISDNDIYWNNYNYSSGARSSGPAAATAAAPPARAARAAAAGDSSSATDQGNSAAADRPKAARAHAARADR